MVAAADDEATAQDAQRLFATADVPGVHATTTSSASSWAGALKNVIAIAAGILEGLGLGHNPRAALITRGLAEITRLGVAMGADPLTFAGLAGMGDLVLTTTGSLSRNRALGVALAQGESLEEYRAAHRTRGRRRQHLARRRRARRDALGVELPITEQVCDVLFEREAAARGGHRADGRANSSRSNGDDAPPGRSRSSTRSARSAR